MGTCTLTVAGSQPSLGQRYIPSRPTLCLHAAACVALLKNGTPIEAEKGSYQARRTGAGKRTRSVIFCFFFLFFLLFLFGFVLKGRSQSGQYETRRAECLGAIQLISGGLGSDTGGLSSRNTTRSGGRAVVEYECTALLDSVAEDVGNCNVMAAKGSAAV